jgi:glycogen operon protein
VKGEAGLTHVTERGEQEPDQTFLILMNAPHTDVGFRRPERGTNGSWRLLMDTSAADDMQTTEELWLDKWMVKARSLQLLVLAQKPA